MRFPPGVFTRRNFCNLFSINDLVKTASIKRLIFGFVLFPSDLSNSMERRKFYNNILHHCYQRTADDGVLFYTLSDHLVYFTLYCVLARKYSIRVLALCQMPDHVHDGIIARRQQDFVEFRREQNARFAKMYNANAGTSGPVFESPFGSAPKLGAKIARTNIIYIANNPVERQLVKQAEDYRWNYLAYMITSHPFSEEIIIRRASKALRNAIKTVRAQFKQGLPLNYTLLRNMFRELSSEERQQLTDFIISTYNVIDYWEACRYFDNYLDMIHSIHANTGSEYDLNEPFLGKSDKPFANMTHIMMRECGFEDIHEILRMDNEGKWKLFDILRKHTDVMGAQIAKYLHLPLEKPR